MNTQIKTLLIAWAVGTLSFASTFAAFAPTAQLQTKVQTVGTLLLNIVETKHDANYWVLLWILKQFESKVAGDERKERIVQSLIMQTMDKQWMMPHSWDTMMKKDKMMDHSWDTMMEKDEMMDDMNADVVIDIDGFNFWYSQSEITVNKGDVVQINLSVSEGFHDWVLDEFNATSEAIRSWVTSVTFVADTAGTFEYYCSIWNHRAQWMVGNLIVTDDTMSDDMQSDTMMKDDMMTSGTPLWHVAVGQTIRRISFDWSETAQWTMMQTPNGWTEISVYFQWLPETGADNFYEGRLVRKSPFNFISTGPLTMKDGMYVNERMSDTDYADHNHYVLTLEPNDNDPAPAEHIFEGDL